MSTLESQKTIGEDELLIESVRRRELLYDSSLAEYKDSKKKGLEWVLISQEVGQEGNISLLFIYMCVLLCVYVCVTAQ